MNKMTKWALPLSLLMMVGVQSGAMEASAKTITSDTAKQTSMSNCNWQYNQAYNWVSLNNYSFDTIKVKKFTKAELDKYLASLYGSDNGTTPNNGSNQGTTSNTGSDKGTTPNTGSNQGTTSNKGSDKGTTPSTGSNQGTTSNKGSDKGTTSNTGSNQGTTSNKGSDKGTTSNTGSNQGTTSNTGSDKGTTSNTGSNQGTSSNKGSNNSTTNSNSSSASQFEQQVISLTNAERAKEGLPALQADTKLMQSAKAKSDDMAKNHYFDHTSPTYGSPFDQMKSLGISYKSAGENIAQGQKTPQEVVQAWMQSPGHRANIMNASYTHIGVGFSANGNYWTQQFIQK
ncbi:CAP domain-containing protein [Rummeliibacillus pycnus]|uniref:CAP domain-containing protein n=1 Tax=Rummeliibacillus pycnus TaxID=101070 RepID=UPI0037C744CA